MCLTPSSRRQRTTISAPVISIVCSFQVQGACPPAPARSRTLADAEASQRNHRPDAGLGTGPAKLIGRHGRTLVRSFVAFGAGTSATCRRDRVGQNERSRRDQPLGGPVTNAGSAPG